MKKYWIFCMGEISFIFCTSEINTWVFDAETTTHGEWPIVGAGPRLRRQHDRGRSAAWGLGAQNGGSGSSWGPGGGTVTGKWSNLIDQLKFTATNLIGQLK